MSDPFITVITAAFRLEGLKNVIKDLDSQTYQKFHHLIINDNQEDIRNWAKNYKGFGRKRFFIDLRVRTHWFGAICRNIGVVTSFSYIKPKYLDYDNLWIAFFDDDNRWKPNHLETFVSEIKKNPELVLLGVDAELRGKKDKSYRHIRKLAFAPQNVDLGQLLYKRSLFDKYGLFQPSPRYRITYDWELIKKIHSGEDKKKIKIIHSPTFIYYHRRR